jgi:hypothetical protein
MSEKDTKEAIELARSLNDLIAKARSAGFKVEAYMEEGRVVTVTIDRRDDTRMKYQLLLHTLREGEGEVVSSP